MAVNSDGQPTILSHPAMCKDCGCGNVESFHVHTLTGEAAGHGRHHHADGVTHTHSHRHADGTVHEHEHNHEHNHEHEHGAHEHDHTDHHHHGTTTALDLHAPILAKNDRLAERNRGFLKAKGIVALNFLSSPGAGKTTLLEKTLAAIARDLPAAVINGDLATANDAERLHAAGAPVAQITTGTVCHLDAEMVAQALADLPLDGCRLLLIENVGNLVCPASYDLGETYRVVLFSVTEGEDKPLKYPPIFHAADLVIVTKTDLTEAAGFDREAALRNLSQIAHHSQILELSARTGAGMDAWLAWLRERAQS
jgi:hydrogenase nickel incorporation protein HypB